MLDKFIKMKKIRLSAAMALMMLLASLSRAGSPAQSLGGITLTQVVPRVVTPNGDMLNDVIYFKFDDTISGLPIESEILDVRGAKIANMNPDSTETALLWDGKDEGGRNVPAGIYIYSIKLGNRQATGTVVVAR